MNLVTNIATTNNINSFNNLNLKHYNHCSIQYILITLYSNFPYLLPTPFHWNYPFNIFPPKPPSLLSLHSNLKNKTFFNFFHAISISLLTIFSSLNLFFNPELPLWKTPPGSHKMNLNPKKTLLPAFH